ncbi:aminotransferase family protein [Paraliomyxa miuraensis]|uniref:aminotransferase family protein n=1 Tax=Paraliomyxa miuraensis TaxID=376150 RepID=UPI00224D4642|nr:aminotransferase class III-fold pyridoxal phosphate-dependent enzyme [Paraliomyxa miuraensis]MCX4245225.1 aminotransferase class III-fold pyridoxal phosphate-dependent enzyme [Paraliomyxa miuraensis]
MSRPFLVRGSGYRVWDQDGRMFIDAMSSALNANCGHGDPRIADAAHRQMQRIAHFDLGVGTHAPAQDLARALASVMPDPALRWTTFVNSGSEATEAAIRIVHDYWGNRGDPRRHVVSFAAGYHGSTVLAKSLTTIPRNATEVTLSFPISRIPMPAPPRALREGLPDALLDAFREAMEAQPTAAVVVEPLLNVGGGIVLPTGFLRGLRALCDETGALLVLDEVFCGLGRTGRMFGFDHEGVVPDIVTTSKGLAAGYVPIASVTCHQTVYESFTLPGGLGALHYGHTTGGHAVGCAAALEVLRIVRADELCGNAAARGAELLEGLGALVRHERVVDVRGLGLVVSVELASEDDAAEVLARALEQGVIPRQQGRHIMAVPPLVLDRAGVDELVTKLSAAVDQVLGHVRS